MAGRNHAPLSVRNVSPQEANATMNRYNTESTYNTWANDNAFSHLSALHHYVGMIGEHPEAQSAENAPIYGQVKEAVSTAIRHHNAKFVGDTLADVQSGEGVSGAGARAHVDAAGVLLGNMRATHPALSEMITQAQNSIGKYNQAYQPARLDTNEKNKKTTGEQGLSVVVDPEYRKNIFDYPRPKEATPQAQKDADKDWAAAMKQTADGRYRKTAEYEANKKAKGYKKPPKKAQGE